MDGILPFLKPPGITSHDAVGIVRRLLKEKRVGHSGTLDPMAMGVLPIYVGKATRLVEYDDEVSKTYIGEGRFGIETDTEDSTGRIIRQSDLAHMEHISFERFQSACHDFIGPSKQRPSSFSAIKVNGVRAYELARKGDLVQLPERDVTIYSLEIMAYQFPHFTIKVECSGGTYIRALIRDLCAKVGSYGIMTSLVRSQVGLFTLGQSYCAEEVELHGASLLLPIDSGLGRMKRLDLTVEYGIALWQGKRIPLHKCVMGESSHIGDALYSIYVDEKFLGIGEVKRGILKGKKLITPLT